MKLLLKLLDSIPLLLVEINGGLLILLSIASSLLLMVTRLQLVRPFIPLLTASAVAEISANIQMHELSKSALKIYGAFLNTTLLFAKLPTEIWIGMIWAQSIDITLKNIIPMKTTIAL